MGESFRLSDFEIAICIEKVFSFAQVFQIFERLSLHPDWFIVLVFFFSHSRRFRFCYTFHCRSSGKTIRFFLRRCGVLSHLKDTFLLLTRFLRSHLAPALL